MEEKIDLLQGKEGFLTFWKTHCRSNMGKGILPDNAMSLVSETQIPFVWVGSRKRNVFLVSFLLLQKGRPTEYAVGCTLGKRGRVFRIKQSYANHLLFNEKHQEKFFSKKGNMVSFSLIELREILESLHDGGVRRKLYGLIEGLKPSRMQGRAAKNPQQGSGKSSSYPWSTLNSIRSVSGGLPGLGKRR